MKDVLVNIGHTAIAKVMLMAVQLAVATLLARNLSAEDYGVFGFANVLMALLLRLKGMGLTQAVVRTPELEPRTSNTAATLNIVFSISAFLCAQASAPLVGHLLGSPASVPVVRVLAFGFLLSPLGFLPTCLLIREMRFGILRAPAVGAAVVRGIVAVALAVSGWKYWSLVIGDLMATLANNGVLHLIRSVPYRWTLDREEIRRLLGYGVPLTLASLVTFVALNVDNFAIGAALGAGSLGFYTVAFTWATFVCTTLQEVVHSVLFPKFSEIQRDIGRMRQAYVRSLLLVGFSAALINGALFVVADDFLFHILGKGTARWLPAAQALRILCIYGVVRAMVETVGNPIMALGNTRLLLKATGLASLVEIGLIPFVVRAYEIEGVSLLVTFAYSSQCLFYVPFILKTLGVRWTALLKVIIPIAAALAMGVVAVFALPNMDSLAWKASLLRLCVYLLTFLALHELLSKGGILGETRLIWRTLVGRATPTGG
ncbi:MAG: lipopolysaccharide biosynthesis protein [Candidatus Methanomethylicaceae archaeon]